MTDKPLDAAVALLERIDEIGPLPIDPLWTYEAIRHCQRNMHLDLEEGFNEPERYAGTLMAEIVNAFPDLARKVIALEGEVAAMRAADQEAGDGWRFDMENAPKEGVWIIAMTKRGEVVPVRWGVSWGNQHWANGCVVYDPIAWQPLPATPPQPDRTKESE